jgi:hypothetical protein
MSTSGRTPQYALGNTDAEHERLIRQAMILAPLTERFFRQAAFDPANVSWILDPALVTWQCLQRGLLAPRSSLRSELLETRTIASKPARYGIVTSNQIGVLE